MQKPSQLLYYLKKRKVLLIVCMFLVLISGFSIVAVLVSRESGQSTGTDTGNINTSSSAESSASASNTTSINTSKNDNVKFTEPSIAFTRFISNSELWITDLTGKVQKPLKIENVGSFLKIPNMPLLVFEQNSTDDAYLVKRLMTYSLSSGELEDITLPEYNNRANGLNLKGLSPNTDIIVFEVGGCQSMYCDETAVSTVKHGLYSYQISAMKYNYLGDYSFIGSIGSWNPDNKTFYINNDNGPSDRRFLEINALTGESLVIKTKENTFGDRFLYAGNNKWFKTTGTTDPSTSRIVLEVNGTEQVIVSGGWSQYQGTTISPDYKWGTYDRDAPSSSYGENDKVLVNLETLQSKVILVSKTHYTSIIFGVWADKNLFFFSVSKGEDNNRTEDIYRYDVRNGQTVRITNFGDTSLYQ